jgi:hypothetical protein
MSTASVRVNTAPLVAMPLAGKWHMLRWYTDDDRGHIILAPTARSLGHVAARVFAEHEDAAITDYCEIEIVGPSRRMNELATEHNRRERVAMFHREVVTAIQAVVKAGRAIPGPFVLCRKYAPEKGGTVDAWTKEQHYGCANCMDTLQLVGLTPHGLYEAYYDRWTAAAPNGRLWDYHGRSEKLQPSRAPAATARERLWYASADFGPHAKGVRLDKVDLDEADLYRPRCLTNGVLFFYRYLRQLDPAPLQTKLDAAMAANTKRRDAEASKSIAERAAVEAQRVAATIAFFKHR